MTCTTNQVAYGEKDSSSTSTRPAKVCAQDFIWVGLIFPEGRRTPRFWHVALGERDRIHGGSSHPLTDGIARVRRGALLALSHDNLHSGQAARDKRHETLFLSTARARRYTMRVRLCTARACALPHPWVSGPWMPRAGAIARRRRAFAQSVGRM